MDQSQSYRRVLRVSAVVVAVVLVFQSGLASSQTPELFNGTAGYLGATVGMSASVAPNEFNTVTAELAKQRQLLAAREAAVIEREIEVGLASAQPVSNDARTTYVLAAILFVQLVLIVLNYALDFARGREHRPEAGVVGG